tara:strand:+ start:290 stop:448 length:159 start_codon:yes stop_codon:yes gene_type:complete
MCPGDGCPLKNECYRYRAKKAHYDQLYFRDAPNDGRKCEYFIRFREESKVKK